MAHLYNDANFTYNASNLTYNGVATYIATATGTGTSSFDATGVRIVLRTASASGMGTSLTAIVVGRLRTAYGEGGAITASSGTGLHIAPRTATSSGTGTSSALAGILFIRTATGSGASTQTANWTKSLIFRPPVEDRFPWSDYRDSSPSHRLFARANPGYRARNIFRLTTGVYTNVDPLDPNLVDKVYLGAHEHYVTEQEKADLVAAGYTVT